MQFVRFLPLLAARGAHVVLEVQRHLDRLLSPRAVVLSTYALCGFANISSIAIQIGGIGALAPDRQHDLARLGVRALLAGTLVNLANAAIAGILL